MDRVVTVTAAGIAALLTVAAVVGAGALVANSCTAFYRRSLGARRIARDRLHRLAPGVRRQYFIDQLGEPAWSTPTATGTKLTFVSSWWYVAAHVEDETVTAFVVTLRRRLRVRLAVPTGNGPIDLRRAHLSEWGTPTVLEGRVGARRYGYLEAHYYGNPGHYQTFLVGFNDAAPGDMGYVTFFDVGGQYRDLAQPLRGEPLDALLGDETVRAFRSRAQPNTYGTSLAMPPELDSLIDLGPDLDTVRLLP